MELPIVMASKHASVPLAAGLIVFICNEVIFYELPFTCNEVQF